MKVQVDVTPKKITAWFMVGSTFLTVLVGVATWFLTADLRHELTLKNSEVLKGVSEAVEYLQGREEEYDLIWGEARNDRLEELGLERRDAE